MNSSRSIDQCADLLAGNDEDDMREKFTGVPSSHDYAPYGNKTVRASSYVAT
jgi:hypothetical protein